MSKPVVVSDQSFADEVLNAEGPVLVDFWAPWCGPCKQIGPIIEELSADFAGKLKVCKLNVDENNSTATQYGVFSIPTLLVFKAGDTVERLVGFMPKQRLVDKLQPHIGPVGP